MEVHRGYGMVVIHDLTPDHRKDGPFIEWGVTESRY
jgi:hypothetical protein